MLFSRQFSRQNFDFTLYIFIWLSTREYSNYFYHDDCSVVFGVIFCHHSSQNEQVDNIQTRPFSDDQVVFSLAAGYDKIIPLSGCAPVTYSRGIMSHDIYAANHVLLDQSKSRPPHTALYSVPKNEKMHFLHCNIFDISTKPRPL